jgi:hypothetical protein
MAVQSLPSNSESPGEKNPQERSTADARANLNQCVYGRTRRRADSERQSQVGLEFIIIFGPVPFAATVRFVDQHEQNQ